MSSIFGKSTILSDDIKELDCGEISDDIIAKSIEIVYAKFAELGGSSMVAKGSSLATAVAD